MRETTPPSYLLDSKLFGLDATKLFGWFMLEIRSSLAESDTIFRDAEHIDIFTSSSTTKNFPNPEELFPISWNNRCTGTELRTSSKNVPFKYLRIKQRGYGGRPCLGLNPSRPFCQCTVVVSSAHTVPPFVLDSRHGI